VCWQNRCAPSVTSYAVRAGDAATVPVTLNLIGTSAAGHAFKGKLKSRDAVRIFTGAPVPGGADAVVIQENTEGSGNGVIILQSLRAGQNIRPIGLDFKRKENLLPAAIRLNARDIGLAAAMNCDIVSVRRKPVVAVIATGDELVLPGQRPRPDQIVSSNSNALVAMAEGFGCAVVNCGIIPDNLKATERAVLKMAEVDVLITTGGASVGDHDFIQQALKNTGVKIDFWKIALRPGKPFMYGRKGKQHVMGLPGNPVSALVCARLFLKPLLNAMQGVTVEDPVTTARLGVGMAANDGRQDYVRARLVVAADGARTATPFNRQDSSMQRSFRDAHCLIIRPPHAPEAPAGGLVPILNLDF
jgi:molybdopterin molybdotransferase